MVCFEVTLNGERLCTAGVAHGGGLQAIVNHVGRGLVESAEAETPPTPVPKLTIAGMHRPDPTTIAQSIWVDRPLQEGDVVTLRVVNAPVADPPEFFDVKTDAELRQMQREHHERTTARFEHSEG